jgi:hypothetical protein
LESPHKLLNTYIERHTTCLPGDTGDLFTPDEPELHIEVELRSFEWDRLRLGRLVLQLPIPPFDIRQICPHLEQQRRLCSLT